MKIWGYKTCTQVRHRVSHAAGLSHCLTEAAGPGARPRGWERPATAGTSLITGAESQLKTDNRGPGRDEL